MSEIHKAEYATFDNLTVCVVTYMDGSKSVGESIGGRAMARSLAEHKYTLRTRFLGIRDDE